MIAIPNGQLAEKTGWGAPPLVRWMNEVGQSIQTLVDGDYINVKNYGAKGDGVTDDTSAFARAVIVANSTGSVVIYVPPGNYLITAQLPDITAQFVTIRGEGVYASKITTSAALLLNFVGAYKCCVLGLHVACSGTSQTVFSVEGATFGTTFRDIYATGCTTFLRAGQTGVANTIYLQDVLASAENVAGATIVLYQGAGLFMSDCYLTVPVGSIAAIAASRYAIHHNGTLATWDVINVANSFMLYHDVSVVLQAGTGFVSINHEFCNSYFDGNKSFAVLFQTSGSGVLAETSWVNCWFSCPDGGHNVSFQATTANTLVDHVFTNCLAEKGDYGWVINSAENWSLIGCRAYGVTLAGVIIGNNLTNYNITGSRFGENVPTVSPTQAQYGIIQGTGNTNFSITGNVFAGSIAPGSMGSQNGVEAHQWGNVGLSDWTSRNLVLSQAGNKVFIKEGANASMGLAVLVAGTVTVNTTAVTAVSRIQLTNNVGGGTPGFLRVSARVAGTSFTITSSNGADTSSVAWLIVEPAP